MGFQSLTAVAGAVGKVEIPPLLRDFQAEGESPASGLFHVAPFSTALLTHRFCYRAEIKFGQSRAVTKLGDKSVHLTARCSVGVLTDEFLHAWNNFGERRGLYLDEAGKEEHQKLGRDFRLSGSSNDRRFHQLELENYVRCLRNSREAIPVFVWRTFTALNRAG